MPPIELTDEQIVDRIKFAKKWLERFKDSDRTASRSYIDANNAFIYEDADWDDNPLDQQLNDQAEVPEAVPVGQPNYATINNEIKIKSVSCNAPKLHIQANENPQMGGFPGAPAVVQQAWEQAYEKWDYDRTFRKAWQKRGICGIGCLWYRWDTETGFQIEAPTSNRYWFDPHAPDFRHLRYAGVTIRLPLSEAQARYPDDSAHPEDPNFPQADSELGTERNAERATVAIDIYFDSHEEIHVHDEKVLHRSENLYRTIPMEFRLGTINPLDKLLPLGDNVLVRGLNQQRVDLAAIASNVAKNGGPITLFDENYFDPKSVEALQNGSSSQMIGMRKAINPQAPPIHRTPGEQLSPAFGLALQDVSATLDAAMGTSPSQRGEMAPGQTATQSVMAESRAGASQIYEVKEFEKMCTRIAQAFVFCCKEFGGPTKEQEQPVDIINVWKAFKAVNYVKTIEGSTSYQNSGMELQQSMQLYTTVVTSLEAWMSLAAKGMVSKIPKLQMIFEDMLNASGRQNTEEYWEQAPPPPQGPATVPADIVKALQTLYDKVPPDVQRQIEQIIGLQPSQTGHPPEAQPEDHAVTAMHAEMAMQAQKISAEHQMQESDHVHEMRMQILELQKEMQLLLAKAQLTPEPIKETPKKEGKS